MDQKYYKEYYHLERNHWWFRARLEILESMLQKIILPSNQQAIKVLNAGVATGATTTMLEKYGAVTSLEYDKDCCTFLKNELKIEVTNASLTDLPFENNSFDLVCAFDVVEHIEDDQLAVSEINRVLKKDGMVFLTVPAFNFLWSHHDEVNHHFRRYTSSQLTKVVSGNRFAVNHTTYFNALLFPPIFLIRIFSKLLPKKKNIETTGSDFERFNSSSFINKCFYWIFKKEKWWLDKKWSFPFGVSLMLIGKKTNID